MCTGGMLLALTVVHFLVEICVLETLKGSVEEVSSV